YRFARVPMRRAATSGVAGTGHAAGGRQYRTQWKTAYRLVRAWPFQPQARVYDQRLACTTSRASHLIRICTTQAEPDQHDQPLSPRILGRRCFCALRASWLDQSRLLLTILLWQGHAQEAIVVALRRRRRVYFATRRHRSNPLKKRFS